jgi:hypothetical protein
MSHGPIGREISFRCGTPKAHPRDTLKALNIAPGGPMDRLTSVLALGDAHAGALNRESSIVRSDRLSCATHPRQNVIRLER